MVKGFVEGVEDRGVKDPELSLDIACSNFVGIQQSLSYGGYHICCNRVT